MNWRTPGFKFYTDEMRAWLGGYEPVIARELCAPAAGKPLDAAASDRLREAQMQGANVWRGYTRKVKA